MNSIMQGYFSTFEMYQRLRNQLLELITDDDLGYRPTETNPTLGELCREIGEVERAYIESFRTFKLDFSYRNTDAGLTSSVQQLSAWFAALDAELKATIAGLAKEEIVNRVIDRGHFTLPPQINLDVYKEALLIFYGKTSVYMKALGRPLSEQWQQWIG